jgi:putative transposase
MMISYKYPIVLADQEQQPLPETGEAVGLDVGLTSFVVDSVGNEIENPRCAEQSDDKLESKNYGMIKSKIAKLHKRINCQRDDFLHKLSRIYVNKSALIANSHVTETTMLPGTYSSQGWNSP